MSAEGLVPMQDDLNVRFDESSRRDEKQLAEAVRMIEPVMARAYGDRGAISRR